MNSRPEIVPVILVGGPDAPLWPLATSKRPKAFLSLRTGLSFFQRTALRVKAFSPPIIVCHERYQPQVLRELMQIKVEPRAIVLEPDFKGTAAAITAAALMLKGQGALMLVQPSDHVLKNVRVFEKAVIESIAYTIENMILLGVKPTEPETDYGYIVVDEAPSACKPMRKFIEKPNATDAQALIEREDCFWNTGMFLTRPSVFLQQMELVAPKIYNAALGALEGGVEENVSVQLDRNLFSGIGSLSVDNALMKNTSRCLVREINIPWSDVGSLRRLIKWWREERMTRKAESA